MQTAHLRLERVARSRRLDERGRGVALRAAAQRYGIAPEEANEIYRVGRAAADDAALLEIDAGTPVFIVERITCDERGPFEFTRLDDAR